MKLNKKWIIHAFAHALPGEEEILWFENGIFDSYRNANINELFYAIKRFCKKNIKKGWGKERGQKDVGKFRAKVRNIFVL